jgi:hypothetical protein
LKLSPQPVPAEITFDDTSKREAQAETESQQRTQKGIRRAAIAAFFAAALYAGVAALQLWEMRVQTEQAFRQSDVENADASFKAVQWFQQFKLSQQQVKAAQDSAEAIQRQMRQDQRPWISVELGGTPVPNTEKGTVTFNTVENQPIEIPLRITNVGKTPARRVEAQFFVEIVKNGQIPDLHPKKKADNGYSAGIIFPNIPNPTNASRLRPIIRSEMKDLVEGKSYIAAHGRVDYRDVFNIPHWATFCLWVPFANAMFTSHECANYNNVDQN